MNSKIKVFVDVFCYKTSAAGIKTYIDQLNHGFKNYQNKNIEYIFSHNILKNTKHSFYFNSNYRFVRLVYHLHYFLWKQIVLPIKTYFYNVDYLICPDFVLPFCKLNAKKICVIHDTLFWDYPESYNYLWRKYFLKMISLGIDDFTEIVTTSKYSKSKINRIFQKNNIHVNYQSILISNKLLTTPIFYKNNFKYILHVGSFEIRKNLLLLVKAFKILKEKKDTNIKLILAGNNNFFGNSSVKNNINLFLKKNKLLNEVIMPGYLSDSEVSFLYANATTYVFPSIDEGFGIPVLEAFYFNCPILCSNTGALKEVAGDAALFFDKNSCIDLSEKLIKIIYNEQISHSLILKGKNRLNTFSLEKFIKNFENIITD